MTDRTLFCSSCRNTFVDYQADVEFRARVAPLLNGNSLEIPPPELCPDCRRLRRALHANDHRYYSRQCSRCSASMISVHCSDAQYPVYCYDCWWGDGWDRYATGAPFDPTRSFFEQFQELRLRTPQLAMINDNGRSSENCAYCQNFAFGKNCYLTVGGWNCQDVLYSSESGYCRDVVDCSFVSLESELVYESLCCIGLYRCAFLEACSNCRECFFGYDLRGCDSCFGCIALRNKRYCFFNEQLSEAAYREAVLKVNLASHHSLRHWGEEFARLRAATPLSGVLQVNCENCEGDALFRCKNSSGFKLFDAEHCRYYYNGDAPKNSQDIDISGLTEWCYQGLSPDESYECLFTISSWRNRNCCYVDSCHSSKNLFGCVSLLRAEYAVLNRRYSKDEYERLVLEIYREMSRRGEWGRFFPATHSLFAYNESRAMEIAPCSEEEALQRGFSWRTRAAEARAVPPSAMPDSIAEANDAICSEVFACGVCARPFKIVRQELLFLRKMELALPRCCPDCRRARRSRSRPTQLQTRHCADCNAPIASVFSEAAQKRVRCETCHLATL